MEGFIKPTPIDPEKRSETVLRNELESFVERVEFYNGLIFVPYTEAAYALGPIDVEDPHRNSPLSPNAGEKVGEWFCPIVVLDDESMVLIEVILNCLLVHAYPCDSLAH